MSFKISPTAEGSISLPPQEITACSKTADKIVEFFTRIEGTGTIFSLLAGSAVALLWGVQLGLIVACVGVALSFILSFFESFRPSFEPLEPDVESPKKESAPPLTAHRYTPDNNLKVYNETVAYAQENLQKEQEKTISSSKVISGLKPTAAEQKYPDMAVYVANKSTLRMTEDLINRGLNPLVMNMANAYHPGGNPKHANAQEEILCRQSTLMSALHAGAHNKKYPIPECGGFLLPGVVFFRADPNDQYAFLEQPFEADVYAFAAFMCNSDHDGKRGARPKSDQEYREKTTVKIEQYFRAAIENGNDSLVASAFGCGAFKNDPVFMANLFKEILEKPEFKGRFKEVAFGIIEDRNSAGGNFATFANILGVR